MNRPDIEKLRNLFKNNPYQLKLLETMYKNIAKQNFPKILEFKLDLAYSNHSLKKFANMLGYKFVRRKKENRLFLIRKDD